MNPVPVMKLVEVIRGLATCEETLRTTVDLATKMGKTTTQSKDFPGFIANRILMPYINEAVFALQEVSVRRFCACHCNHRAVLLCFSPQCCLQGVGTPDDIDTTMKLGTNVPMGPLTLADFIGLDTVSPRPMCAPR